MIAASIQTSHLNCRKGSIFLTTTSAPEDVMRLSTLALLVSILWSSLLQQVWLSREQAQVELYILLFTYLWCSDLKYSSTLSMTESIHCFITAAVFPPKQITFQWNDDSLKGGDSIRMHQFCSTSIKRGQFTNACDSMVMTDGSAVLVIWEYPYIAGFRAYCHLPSPFSSLVDIGFRRNSYEFTDSTHFICP